MSPVNPVSLPNHATLDRMRREAKLLQRAVRAGDPQALRLLTRHGVDRRRRPRLPAHPGPTRGRPGARLRQLAAPQALLRHGRRPPLRAGAGAGRRGRRRPVRAAGLPGLHPGRRSDRWTAARALLAEHPATVRAGRVGRGRSRRRRHGSPTAHRRPGSGPPTRRGVPLDAAVLPHLLTGGGANGGRGDRPPPAGRRRRPGRGLPVGRSAHSVHPGDRCVWAAARWAASGSRPFQPSFARMLLEAGADPNDGQALYNRQFEPATATCDCCSSTAWVEGDGGPWRRLLGDVVDDPAELLRRSAVLGGGPRHDGSGRAADRTRCRPDRRRPARPPPGRGRAAQPATNRSPRC